MVAEESKRLEKQTEKLESCESKDEKLGDKGGRDDSAKFGGEDGSKLE